ncbi:MULTISPECIES: hypothetical protein [unclassified Myxococcus]|uniref:LexA family protein n=1 Tax=Myxococcus TaxID=32 RepID=UPI0013900A90|nr:MULTISPECIES: hypothetical protein [unclassified Myxococcus]NOK06217.1 hypothetical protein [Myxococcus xanthus]
MKGPTALQRAVLLYLAERKATADEVPSLQELCDHFQWSSVNAAADVLRRLERRGLLRLKAGKARSPRLTPEGEFLVAQEMHTREVANG